MSVGGGKPTDGECSELMYGVGRRQLRPKNDVLNLCTVLVGDNSDQRMNVLNFSFGRVFSPTRSGYFSFRSPNVVFDGDMPVGGGTPTDGENIEFK